MMTSDTLFSTAILEWFDQHGRKHLPWQQNKTPYLVWISEIMLQQTQVNTVIPYFERFMLQFPDLPTLANASIDDVLHAWAGLGYYSRARNLHRAAQMVMHEFQGRFPDTLETLQQLPGIGRSTAGAILSIAYQQRATILDGNVKRVLARYLGEREPVNDKAVETRLWEIAERYTPHARNADYTQAIMDLGATLCTRSKPNCPACPLLSHCKAYADDLTTLLPAKKATRGIPTRTATFLILQSGQHVLLLKRPSQGIWGGLWSLPEISGVPDKKLIRQFCQTEFHLHAEQYTVQPPFRHTFSHYHLDIHPVIIHTAMPAKVMECAEQIWYKPDNPPTIGLPKPIQMILRTLA
jgi:A/G-specific adenine glycosylase